MSSYNVLEPSFYEDETKLAITLKNYIVLGNRDQAVQMK